MCRHSALRAVCWCDGADMQAQRQGLHVHYCMHFCNILIILPTYTLVHQPHTVTGWGGSKQGYLCCHDNSEATPCFLLYPTPNVHWSEQSAGKRRRLVVLSNELRFNMSRKTKWIKYLLLIDLISQHLQHYNNMTKSKLLLATILIFLPQRAVKYYWNMDFYSAWKSFLFNYFLMLIIGH